MINVIDEYKFKEGDVYLVKCLDHFTKHDPETKNVMFFNVIGVYLDETEFYYHFKSYFYNQEHDDHDTFNDSIGTYILKGTLYEVLEVSENKRKE